VQLRTEDIYEAAQSIKGSHSGKGNSYYEVAANCGEQRHLQDKYGKDLHSNKDWAIRGTYYHLLRQWSQEGRAPSVIELRDDDTLWNEAVTLNSWYLQTYPKNMWGDLVATEMPLPQTDEQRDILARLFDVPPEYAPTVRLDMLTRATDEHVEQAAEYGVYLPGPGLYIPDWKHGGAHFGDDEMKFTWGPQPVLYLTVAQLLLGEPIQAMVFNKVSMTKEKGALKLKDTSFRNYVTSPTPGLQGRAIAMIQFAYRQFKARTKNGYACLDCPFHQNLCEGPQHHG
jgi:hypothetical protein